MMLTQCTAGHSLQYISQQQHLLKTQIHKNELLCALPFVCNIVPQKGKTPVVRYKEACVLRPKRRRPNRGGRTIP